MKSHVLGIKVALAEVEGCFYVFSVAPVRDQITN